MDVEIELPADTGPYRLVEQGAAADPAQAAVIDAGEPGAFRAGCEAFSHEPGPHAELAAAGVAMLMYAGTADPWHDPMRTFAERTGAGFFSLPDTDHQGGWDRSAEALPHVLPFLADDLDA